ncbi:MAG: ATP-binding protein [Nitrospiria bacterium]
MPGTNSVSSGRPQNIQILESLPAGVFCTTSNQIITYVNPSLCQTTGYTPFDFTGKHFDMLQGENTQTRIPWEDLLNGTPWRGSISLRKKDGQAYLADLSISPILSGESQIIGFAGIQNEINPPQKFLPTQLQYKKALDISENSLLLQNRRGDLLQANPAFCNIFGASESEIIEQGLPGLLTAEGCTVLQDKILPESLQLVSAKGEVEGIRKGGDLFELTITAMCIRNSNNIVEGFVSLFQDRTKEKEIQHQRNQSKKLATMGEMLAGVAHELNNPLTSVVGFSELLLRRKVNKDIKKQLRKISSEAIRTSKIVQNLLSVVRSHKPEKILVGMNGVIHNVLELKSRQLRVDNIRVVKKLTPDNALPKVIGDYQQMVEVLLNLVNNAHYAMVSYRQKGTLTVKTETVGDSVYIRVKDTGPGVPEEIRSKLFQPFFTTKSSGTGLGLSISRDIVKEHFGDLVVEETKRGGTTFIIRLPIAPDQITQPTEASEEAFPHAETLKILVVDDEEMILDFYYHFLTQLGHKPHLVKSVKEALQTLESEQYDLIISDIKIPGINGETFYDLLKTRQSPLTKRFIFVTGDILSESINRVLKRNHICILHKPFVLSQLERTINLVVPNKRVHTAFKPKDKK